MNNRRPMSWRDALRAMAVNARARAKNSKAPPSGPRDPHTVGHAEGAAYAFTVMAEELEYIADNCDSKKALKRLRTLLDLQG